MNLKNENLIFNLMITKFSFLNLKICRFRIFHFHFTSSKYYQSLSFQILIIILILNSNFLIMYE